MSILKAIETRYNGYLFRSRLEARWAVFLDRLSVDYEYEVEGFDLSSVPKSEGGRDLMGKAAWYLPDFWLPEPASWMEVKPTAPTLIERERAARLAVASGKDVVIVVGKPWVFSEHESGYDGTDSGYIFLGGTGLSDHFYMLTACPFCRKVEWTFDGRADRISCKCPNPPKSVGDFARIQRAYLAAKRARFEHGETPIVGGA